MNTQSEPITAFNEGRVNGLTMAKAICSDVDSELVSGMDTARECEMRIDRAISMMISGPPKLPRYRDALDVAISALQSLSLLGVGTSEGNMIAKRALDELVDFK